MVALAITGYRPLVDETLLLEHGREPLGPCGIDDQLGLAQHRRVRSIEESRRLARLELLQSLAELFHRLNMSFKEHETRPFGVFAPEVGAAHRELPTSEEAVNTSLS